MLIEKRNEMLRATEDLKPEKAIRVSDQEFFHNMGITVGKA